MISVQEADNIISAYQTGYGTESVALEKATGRTLAEDLPADRDMPPFNRATMDGIAINTRAYEQGFRQFRIKGIQAAGDPPIELDEPAECIEIMTGSALPETADAVIPYEELVLQDQQALLKAPVQAGQNIHAKGKDKKKAALLVASPAIITPSVTGVAAATGRSRLLVKKHPRILIVSTGNELVEIDSTPAPQQIRRSNNYMIRAVLEEYKLVADMLHLPDDRPVVEQQLGQALEAYDVLLLSGGVSMGKFDFVPAALRALEVEELFHKIQQRPGKPFWFGRQKKGTLVFGFPGNPVSTFLCLHRYFVPWIKASLGIPTPFHSYAALETGMRFTPPLQYFVQVSWQINAQGQSVARPAEGNGSGDFSNLLQVNAFMELPATQTEFREGEIFPVWPFKWIF